METTPTRFQSDSFQKHTEKWRAAHDEVMRNYDNADKLFQEAAIGLFLVERASTIRTESFETARMVYQTYLLWLEIAQLLLEAMEASQENGFPVDNLDEFRAAYLQLNAYNGTFHERIAALDAAINGECVDARRQLQEVYGPSA